MEALTDELKLFIKEAVFEAILLPNEEQKRNALKVNCFIVEERDGRIKARAEADGRTQTCTLRRKHAPLLSN